MQRTATFAARATPWAGAPHVHRQRDGGVAVRECAQLQAVYSACCKPWTASLTAGSTLDDSGGVVCLLCAGPRAALASQPLFDTSGAKIPRCGHAVRATTVAFHVEWHGLVLVFANVRNLRWLRLVRSGTAPQSAPVALGIGSSLSFHPCSTGLLSTTVIVLLI